MEDIGHEQQNCSYDASALIGTKMMLSVSSMHCVLKHVVSFSEFYRTVY